MPPGARRAGAAVRGRAARPRPGRRAGATCTRPRYRLLVAYGGEQGLLGRWSPGYARDRTFYVNDTARGDGSTRIIRYRAANGRGRPASAQEILRVAQPYANHNGGNLEFGPDGKLWVGLGDGGGGGDPDNNAENRDWLLGKMFLVDPAA